MRHLVAATAFGLGVLAAMPARAQTYQTYPQQPGPAIQDVSGNPPDTVYGPPQDPNAPFDPNDPANYPPTPEDDVTTDDNVAQRYDDGYDPQAYTQFEGALSAYGMWVDDPTYGRVWVPNDAAVGQDFTPYASNGQWTDTEYGWTWASDWDWGWAPFHYGRWAIMAGRGWGWVPGTIWGPGWVAWRAGGGYVGWAALPPRGAIIGRPVGTVSPWRFATSSGFGTARQSYVGAAAVPGAFSKMTVVSNQRVIAGARGPVFVNAGPPRAGHAPVGRMASLAPTALPRLTIQEHTSMPVMNRPWAQASAWRAGNGVGLGAGLVRSMNGELGTPRSGGTGQIYRAVPMNTRPASAPAARPAGRSFAPHSYAAPTSRTFQRYGNAPAARPTYAAPAATSAGTSPRAAPLQGRSYTPVPSSGRSSFGGSGFISHSSGGGGFSSGGGFVGGFVGPSSSGSRSSGGGSSFGPSSGGSSHSSFGGSRGGGGRRR